MGAGFHGGFGPTKGFQISTKPKLKFNLQLFASAGPVSLSGNVSEKSIIGNSFSANQFTRLRSI